MDRLLTYVFTLLFVISLVDSRKIYYPNRDDPEAIVFEGPTNYETRQGQENEICDDLYDQLDVRFGKNLSEEREEHHDIIFPDD